MKTDKIFYTLFQVFPELLFQLLGESPNMAQNYQFKSVEIKELAFRLDGVFIPDADHPDYPLYFVEIQFQKDEDFYWRFITQIFGSSRLCVIIFAYGIVKCLLDKTFKTILRIFYQYRPRFHTETRRANLPLSQAV